MRHRLSVQTTSRGTLQVLQHRGVVTLEARGDGADPVVVSLQGREQVAQEQKQQGQQQGQQELQVQQEQQEPRVAPSPVLLSVQADKERLLECALPASDPSAIAASQAATASASEQRQHQHQRLPRPTRPADQLEAGPSPDRQQVVQLEGQPLDPALQASAEAGGMQESSVVQPAALPAEQRAVLHDTDLPALPDAEQATNAAEPAAPDQQAGAGASVTQVAPAGAAQHGAEAEHPPEQRPEAGLPEQRPESGPPEQQPEARPLAPPHGGPGPESRHATAADCGATVAAGEGSEADAAVVSVEDAGNEEARERAPAPPRALLVDPAAGWPAGSDWPAGEDLMRSPARRRAVAEEEEEEEELEFDPFRPGRGGLPLSPAAAHPLLPFQPEREAPPGREFLLSPDPGGLLGELSPLVLEPGGAERTGEAAGRAGALGGQQTAPGQEQEQQQAAPGIDASAWARMALHSALSGQDAKGEGAAAVQLAGRACPLPDTVPATFAPAAAAGPPRQLAVSYVVCAWGVALRSCSCESPEGPSRRCGSSSTATPSRGAWHAQCYQPRPTRSRRPRPLAGPWAGAGGRAAGAAACRRDPGAAAAGGGAGLRRIVRPPYGPLLGRSAQGCT